MKSSLVSVFLLVWFPAVAMGQETPQQFEGFNLEGYADNGEKAWDVNGEKADIIGQTVEITHVNANRFGKEPVNLKADQGTIDRAQGDIRLKDNVIITAQQGAQLKTDSLNWHKEKDLLTTEDRVKLTDQGMEADGTGLTAHPGLKTAQMNKDVSVRINTEPEKPDGRTITITSEGPMEIDQMNNMAVFKDHVVAIQDDYRLQSDKMEVYFDPQKKKIVQSVCIGNVVIEQGKNQSFAQKAVYQADTQKLTLTGSPRVIMMTAESGNIFGGE